MEPHRRFHHPLIGDYIRNDDGSWRAETTLGCLDYPVHVHCAGVTSEETSVRTLQQAIARLPAYVAASEMNRGQRLGDLKGMPPDYSVATARISSLRMDSAGNVRIFLDCFDDDIGHGVTPCFDLSPRLDLLRAFWTV